MMDQCERFTVVGEGPGVDRPGDVRCLKLATHRVVLWGVAGDDTHLCEKHADEAMADGHAVHKEAIPCAPEDSR